MWYSLSGVYIGVAGLNINFSVLSLFLCDIWNRCVEVVNSDEMALNIEYGYDVDYNNLRCVHRSGTDLGKVKSGTYMIAAFGSLDI